MNKTLEKLEKYRARLKDGKAHKIKPKHVQKMINKLETKKFDIEEDIKSVSKPEKRERLTKKLATIGEQIKQAEWLLSQI
jgi:predicted  nucleic acid-binding Zn-ribbon protein